MDVAVLAGGRSPEHEVSLASTTQVLQHLDRARWRVWPVYLDRAGRWWPAVKPLPAGATWQANDPMAAVGGLRPGAAIDWLIDHAKVGVVLPVLHGPFGEDGTVQGMLELYDLPFVGSGCAASAVAMDKLRTRQVLQTAGVPLAKAYEPKTPWLRADVGEEFAALQRSVGTPAFVKVDASGSTVGVQRVQTLADLQSFFAGFRGRVRRWFAEQAVTGEEITVAVLGNTGDTLQALPPVGIYPRCDNWFTHEAKYRPGASEEVVPPRGLNKAQIEHVQELAIRCHEALVCDGMSRTDMIVTASGPVVLETNTIPGLTRTSLLPQAAAAAGLTFPRLLDRLLDLALARAATDKVAQPGKPATDGNGALEAESA